MDNTKLGTLGMYSPNSESDAAICSPCLVMDGNSLQLQGSLLASETGVTVSSHWKWLWSAFASFWCGFSLMASVGMWKGSHWSLHWRMCDLINLLTWLLNWGWDKKVLLKPGWIVASAGAWTWKPLLICLWQRNSGALLHFEELSTKDTGHLWSTYWTWVML